MRTVEVGKREFCQETKKPCIMPKLTVHGTPKEMTRGIAPGSRDAAAPGSNPL